MATSTPVSIPIPSSRPKLGWGKDRIQRFLLLDSTLGYLFLLPALLVIVGLVAYPFANAIVMTFQNKTAGAPGRFHWPGQLPGAIGQRGFLAHGFQHRRLYGLWRRAQIFLWAQYGAGAQPGAHLEQSVPLLPAHSLGHPDGHFGAQLALDLRRCQRAHQQCPGASEPGRRDHLLALRPASRHVLGHRGGHLAGHTVFYHELSGRPAGHSQGTLRSGGDRWGVCDSSSSSSSRYRVCSPSSSPRSCCRRS